MIFVYDPTEHDDDAIDALSLYDPIGAAVQFTAPVAVAYDPTRHATQYGAAVSALFVDAPIAHAAHALAPVALLVDAPATHAEHSDDPAVDDA